MQSISKCEYADFPVLSEIWERSVRASHHFLSESDIIQIRSVLVSDYFPDVEIHALKDDDEIMGFIGLRDTKIEMLFIDSRYFRHGYGSLLIEFAIRSGAKEVDVNEQNPDAIQFYKSKGFRIVGRDDVDDSGRPFPILHMSL